MGDVDNEKTRSFTVVLRVLAVLVIIAAVGSFFYLNNGRAKPQKYCTLALGFATVHGRTVVLQDQGGPGKDGCDLPDHGTNTEVGPTLGFDCKVRDSSGKVIDSVTKLPNGTCGSR